jgi:hypothetical protein
MGETERDDICGGQGGHYTLHAPSPVMDSELRYEEHMAKAAIRGLRAAMCLRRLKMLNPRTARQLFVVTVAPAMCCLCCAVVLGENID